MRSDYSSVECSYSSSVVVDSESSSSSSSSVVVGAPQGLVEHSGLTH